MKVLILLSALAFAAGCASMQDQPGLNATVANLRFGEVTMFETTATFTVRLQNESPDPLAIQGGVYKLYLDGTFLGEGLSNQAFEIPGLSEATVDVDTRLSNLTMARKIRGIVESRRFEYKLTGRVYAGDQGRRRPLSIAREGTLDMNEFVPAIRPPSP
jgi:LEA14-like dessication related protein